MEKAFSQIINMSLTGSVVILMVLLGRLVLRKQPKIFSYALWAVVLFRLLCPVSISAPVSALKVAKPEVAQEGQTISRVTFVAAEPVTIATSAPQTAAPVAVKKQVQPMTIAAWIWLAGLGCMGLYSAISYAALQKKLVGSSLQAENVYLSDYVDSPFVMGVLAPKIYLPTSTPPEERQFILAHEQHHVRRLDHIWKLVAYLALCIHWFNPLVWLSFVLAGKDMEMSCDEAVIGKLGEHTRADYATALLRLSTKRTVIRGTPLAFGEGDTKGRVKNMANWKKPKVWVSLVCAVLCVAVLVACAVNPKEENAEGMQTTTETVTVQVPAGYTYDAETRKVTRNADGKLVGGLDIYPIPEGVYDPEDESFDWLYQVGIPDLEAVKAEELRIFKGTSGFSTYDWMMEFVSLEENAADRTVYRRHYFTVVDGQVYDIWQDGLEVDGVFIQMKLSQMYGILEDAKESEPVSKGASIVLDVELVQFGNLSMALTEGLTASEANGKVVLTMDGKTVGGMALRQQKQANSPGIFSSEWMQEIGIPEAGDTTMGYFSSDSLYADYEITYFPDVPVNRDAMGDIIEDEQGWYVLEQEVTHYLFLRGLDVYDVWFYNNRLPDTTREAALKSCLLKDSTPLDAVLNAQGEEQEVLGQCRQVLEQIQSSPACKIETKQENSAFDLNRITMVTTWISGEDRMSIQIIPESGGASRFAYLLVGGVSYEGNSVQEWRETEQWDCPDPWLASFQWEDSVVSYQGTTQDETGTTVMLRIDQPYAEGENQQPHYFVNFRFDTEGAFQNAQVQTNLLTEYATTQTETVVSLDGAEIAGEIQAEAQKAGE